MAFWGVQLHLSQTPDGLNYKVCPILSRHKKTSSNIISAVLARGFGTHSTIQLHFPWSTVAVTEHAWSSNSFVHSRCSMPWLPTCPVPLAPTFPACVWRAGKKIHHVVAAFLYAPFDQRLYISRERTLPEYMSNRFRPLAAKFARCFDLDLSMAQVVPSW